MQTVPPCAAEDVVSQLGTFDGYSRRLLNPPLNGLSAKVEPAQRDSKNDVQNIDGHRGCVACKTIRMVQKVLNLCPSRVHL